MACTQCPQGVTSTTLDYTSVQEPHVQVDSGGPIALKIGEPMSTACQRATAIGQIPEVVRFPNFTTSNGAVVSGVPSNGGIANMTAFFTRKKGCYEDDNMRLASTCC
jgi:hypothetical protein